MEITRYTCEHEHTGEIAVARQDPNGRCVDYDDHITAIAAAVAAERRRVWNEITARISYGCYDDNPVDELSRLRRDLFPDGEPQH